MLLCLANCNLFVGCFATHCHPFCSCVIQAPPVPLLCYSSSTRSTPVLFKLKDFCNIQQTLTYSCTFPIYQATFAAKSNMKYIVATAAEDKACRRNMLDFYCIRDQLLFAICMNEESITLWPQPSCTSLEIAWRALKCNYVQLPSSNQTVSYHTTMVSPCGLVSVVPLSLPHLVLNVKLSEITGVDIALLWLVDFKGRGRIGLSLLEELPFADYGSPISPDICVQFWILVASFPGLSTLKCIFKSSEKEQRCSFSECSMYSWLGNLQNIAFLFN